MKDAKSERIEMYKNRLNAYYEAELAVLSGQKYRLGTRELERADLSEIRNAITELESIVENLKNGGKRKVFRVLPRDI